ncbi:hypothetical protein FGO68_gene15169 [Halteria grandinella]|uniref:Uncharacterized protein n=1 Tax=Halteria grandinella TaxID=5974 RepID=A0A8J8NTP4_HALGN|nr:hypothetical protein FGO68_gene15169 [Halteria grandinella]
MGGAILVVRIGLWTIQSIVISTDMFGSLLQRQETFQGYLDAIWSILQNAVVIVASFVVNTFPVLIMMVSLNHCVDC